MPSTRVLSLPVALVAVAFAGCTPADEPKPRDGATPDPSAGGGEDSLPAGETACSAATADWPALPDLDALITRKMEAGHLPGLSACIMKDGVVASILANRYAKAHSTIAHPPRDGDSEG